MIQKLFLAIVFMSLCNTVMADSVAAATENSKVEMEIFAQLGHSKAVSAITVTPDGKHLLTGSWDNTIKLWDISTGKEIRTFKGHTQPVNTVAISPNGMYVLSGSNNRGNENRKDSLKVWDLGSGAEIRSMGDSGDINSVAFSPDGKYALSAGRGISLWDISAGTKVRTWGQPNKTDKQANGQDSDPDGDKKLTEGLKKYFDEIIGSFGDEDKINSIAFSPDGKHALSGGADNTLKLWDISDGKEIRTFKGHSGAAPFCDGVLSVAFSPDGKYALSGAWDSTVKLWDIRSGKEIRTLKGHTNRVATVAFSPDGKQVLSGGWDNALKIWDLNSGMEIRNYKGLSARVLSAVFSQDGNYLLSGSIDKTSKLWEINSGNEVRTFSGHSADINSAAVSFDGKYILSGSDDNDLNLWDIGSGRKIQAFKGHSQKVNSVALSPDGNYALSGSEDKTLKLWELSSGKEIRTFTGQSAVKSVVISPDGKYVLSAGSGSILTLRDINSAKEIWTIKSDQYMISSIAFSPDGRFLLAGSYDGKLSFWNVSNGTKIKTIENAGSVQAIAISPDGKYALSGSSITRQTIKLWDIASGQKIKSMGGIDFVESIAFSPDGKYALAGTKGGALSFSEDSLKLYDTGTGRAIRTFKGSGNVNFAAFSPEGKYVLAGKNAIRQWETASGKEIAQFSSFSDNEWIVMTPEGYYNSSLNGHKQLNIRLRNSNTVYGIDQFYDVFYRPDIVQVKLKGEDINNMISITIEDAIRNPPPTVMLSAIPNKSDKEFVQLCYSIKSTGGGIGEVRLFQNGKLVKSDGFYRDAIAKSTSEKRQLDSMNSRAIQKDMRGLSILAKEKPDFIVAKSKGDSIKECVELEAVSGENEISVAAFNANNSIQSYMQTAVFESSRKPVEPRLFILAIGIDKYKDGSVNLKYAAKDANDFITKLPEKALSLYKPDNIHVERLLDNQASKANILSKIETLSRKIKHGDSFILFVASHGALVQDQYYIVTSDYNGNLNDTNKLISSNEIVEISKKVKSLSQLFIFDTCHAGGVDNIISSLYDARMSVMAKKMGLHIYASAGSVQTAMDGYRGNGLYTHTLLSGIKNTEEVGKDSNGNVTVIGLGMYSKNKTTEISTQLGHPQTPLIINFGKDSALFAVK